MVTLNTFAKINYAACAAIIFCASLGQAKEQPISLPYVVEEYHDEWHVPETGFLDDDLTNHTFEEFEGNVVVLSFWATWCTSCSRDVVSLDDLAKEFRKKPVKFIALSEDFQGIEKVKEFYRQNKIKYLDIYIDSSYKLFKEFNVVGLPSTFIINPEGNLVTKVTGVIDFTDPQFKELILKHSISKSVGKPMPDIAEMSEVEEDEKPLDDLLQKPRRRDQEEGIPVEAITSVPED